MRPKSPSPAPEPGKSRAAKRGAILLFATVATGVLGLKVGAAASLSVNSANLTNFSTCTLSGSAGGSISMFDSYVDQNAGTTNNGSATTMDSETRNAKNRRPYVQFDLTKCSPTIASGASVKVATLRLWVTAM